MRYRLAITRGICTICDAKGDAVFLGVRAPFKKRLYMCPDCIVNATKPKIKEEDAPDKQDNEVPEVQKATGKKAKSNPRGGRKPNTRNKTQRPKDSVL